MSEFFSKSSEPSHIHAENKMGRIVLVLKGEKEERRGGYVDPILRVSQGSQHSCTCENLL